ncbi:MAG: hypothetical protein ACTHMG_16570 [Sphingomonas sp.]
MERAIALRASPLPPMPLDDGFNPREFRVFTSIPEHRDFGIVALKGLVIIYDEALLHTEGVIENAFYVRERQRPVSGIWDDWLRREWDDRDRRHSPNVPLKVSREVAQAVRWPRSDHWALRLPSGFTDGPYHDWSFGRDLIGKVVGIYRPDCASSH